MKLTDVYIVADISPSMSGAKAAIQRQMVWDVVRTLAADPLPYRVGLIAFGGNAVEKFGLTWAGDVTQTMVDRALGDVIGWTALRDAIGMALDRALTQGATVGGLKAEAVLVSVFSDGEENRSRTSAGALATKIGAAEASGRITLTFAGPESARRELSAAGIPAGNFKAWDGSEREAPEVSRATVAATQEYTVARSKGVKRSATFYEIDPAKLNTAGVRSYMQQVQPTEVQTVAKRMAGRAIADAFQKFEKGKHYYELIKPEYIEDGKELVVHIKGANEYRLGSRSARQLLGLPEDGKIRVKPTGTAAPFTIFVQSASNNRKLVEGQQLLTVP